MANATLYTNFITRENRFANRIILEQALNNATEKQSFEVVGCAITNTSSYVDIKYNRRAPILGGVDALMYSATYVQFRQQSGAYTYFGFVDKVEPDNFNLQGDYENEQYYRVHFTIDWWTTIMYSDIGDNIMPQLKSSLEGVVERGHVADLEVVDRTHLRYLMDYTTESAELPPVYSETKTEPILPYTDLDKPLPWLYVLATREFKTRTGQAGGYIELPIFQNYLKSVLQDKEIDCPLYLWAIPMYGKNKAEALDVYWDITAKKSDGSVGITQRIYMGKTISEPNLFRDSSIVSMFISYEAPVPVSTIGGVIVVSYDYGNNTAWYDRIADEVWSADPDETERRPVIDSALFSAYTSNSVYNGDNRIGLIPVAPPYDNGTTFSIVNSVFSDIGAIVRENRNILQPYNSYNIYLESGIVKQHFFPYKYEYINNYGEHLLISRAFTTDGNLFYYNINPYDGSYVVKMTDLLHKDDNQYLYLHNAMTFTPLSVYDDITETRLVATSTAKQFGVISATYDMAMSFANFGIGIGLASVGVPQGATMAMGGMKGGANGIANAVSSMADLVAYEKEADKVRRDGEGGTQKPAGQYGYTFKPLAVSYVKPTEAFMHTLRKDLALYGYNTYLHPHELFNEIHIRKYFNFIKTSGCVITKPILNTEIRRFIEEMFNNGVWLWNDYEEFGNYEVPNYQKIILEE